jgi:dihydrofolate synthase/folylpolyglutamate synthase
MDTDLAYNQALDYLYSFVDYSLKKSAELARADFNLERMRQLMVLLGNPEQKYEILHVAGTKGKGSTAALMASALTASGRKTGLYTSPHLQDYCERIQIDGQPIPHAQLVGLVDQVKPHVQVVPKLTTFEITTAIALLYFALEGVDAAVWRWDWASLDATNIIAEFRDHSSLRSVAVLGNTLALIAGEKAGIIKPCAGGVITRSVRSSQVLKISSERNSPLFWSVH